MHDQSALRLNFIVFSEDNILRYSLSKLLLEIKESQLHQNINFIYTESFVLNDFFILLLKNSNASLVIFDFDSVFSDKSKIMERIAIAQLYGSIKLVGICNRWDYTHYAFLYKKICDFIIKKEDIIDVYRNVICNEINKLLIECVNNAAFKTSRKEMFHRFPLSNRESEILKLIMKGKSNSEISNILYISAKTVSAHRSNIYAKFNVRTISELYKFLINEKLIRSDELIKIM